MSDTYTDALGRTVVNISSTDSYEQVRAKFCQLGSHDWVYTTFRSFPSVRKRYCSHCKKMQEFVRSEETEYATSDIYKDVE